MSFLHPQLLWLQLLPAALLIAAFRRARTTSASAHPKIPRVLLHSSANSKARATAPRPVRPIALALALAATLLAVARPQGANLPALAHTNAREVLVAVDVSRSMLADDIKPDRLSRARLLIRALLDELKGERLGLLPFAGTAFLQSPLSSDYEIFRTFLDELGPDMIPAGGSNIAALLSTAADAFSSGDADRFLIILSDGEAQDDTWREPAEALAKRGVRIIALGLGTTDGAMVPDGKGGLIKDQRGAAVLTRLDASTLRELARITGGEYHDTTAFVDLPALLRATVSQGRAGQFEKSDTTRRVELFPWFLAPALLLLTYSLWLEFPPVPSPRKTQLLPQKTSQAPVNEPSKPGNLASAARTAARAAALALVFYSALVINNSSFAAGSSASAPAASPPVAPNGPAPDPLVALVGELATASTLNPADLARLADLTASRGEAARAAKKPLPDGALHDALAAIDSGRVTAPSAADWPTLRKRIETLLTPPPKPPKSDTPPEKSPSEKNPSDSQQKSDDASNSPDQNSQSSDSKSSDSQSSDSKSSDQKSSDPSSSSDSQSKSKPENNSKSSEPKSSKSDSSSSSDPSSQSPDPGSPPSPANSPDPSKASAEKPLSSLADKPKPEDDTKSPSDSSAASNSASAPPAPTPPPPSPPDPSTMQQAGGVAAEGTSADSASDPASTNPALALPRQRLDGVRASDSPARLYQLLNETENPPDAAKRSAGGRKQDW